MNRAFYTVLSIILLTTGPAVADTVFPEEEYVPRVTYRILGQYVTNDQAEPDGPKIYRKNGRYIKINSADADEVYRSNGIYRSSGSYRSNGIYQSPEFQ